MEQATMSGHTLTVRKYRKWYGFGPHRWRVQCVGTHPSYCGFMTISRFKSAVRAEFFLTACLATYKEASR